MNWNNFLFIALRNKEKKMNTFIRLATDSENPMGWDEIERIIKRGSKNTRKIDKFYKDFAEFFEFRDRSLLAYS